MKLVIHCFFSVFIRKGYLGLVLPRWEYGIIPRKIYRMLSHEILTSINIYRCPRTKDKSIISDQIIQIRIYIKILGSIVGHNRSNISLSQFLGDMQLFITSIIALITMSSSAPTLGLHGRGDGVCAALNPPQPCSPDGAVFCCGTEGVQCIDGFYSLSFQCQLHSLTCVFSKIGNIPSITCG